MAVRFFDPSGKYLGGGQSYEPIKEAFTPRPSGGGGGGGRIPTAPSGGIDYEAQRQAQEKARQEAIEKERLAKEIAKRQIEARKEYIQKLRTSTSGVSARQPTVYSPGITEEQKRIFEGIDTEAQRKEKLAWEIRQRQLGRTGHQVLGGGFLSLPETYKEPKVELVTKSIPETRIDLQRARAVEDMERARAREQYNGAYKGSNVFFKYVDEKLTKLNTFLSSGSITQKYYELAPPFLLSGFTKEGKYKKVEGIKFYKKGEQEQIIQDVLKEFNEAKDYESQQQAIQNLRNKGIDVNLKDGEYVVDTSKIAPSSKIANILIGATDIMFKGTLFKPFMDTGTAQKTETTAKAKVKTKQDVVKVVKRKLSDLSDVEYSNVINQIRITKTPAELREALIKAVKTGDKAKISDTTKILKDVMGEASATTLIRDVMAQEGLKTIPTATKVSTTTLEIEVGELFNLPKLPLVTRTTTATSLLNPATSNVFIKSEVQPTKLGENVFSATAPTGRIESMSGQGKISSLGELGRTSQTTQQETSQKNILGLKAPQKTELKTQQEARTKQQEGLKQPIALSLGLASLFKQQQRQQQRQTQIQKQLQKPKSGTPTKPTFKFPPIIPPSDLGKSLSKVKGMGEETFEVFGKRFGKDIKLLETTSQQKAEEETLKFLKGTLGRSAKITKGGKALEFKSLRLSRNLEFRPAKRESTRIVQKAKYSLGTGAEVKEIQYFKRRRK